MSGDDDFDGSRVDFLYEFENSLVGREPVDIVRWANRWPDRSTRQAVISSLLIGACEQFEFDLEWLATQQSVTELSLAQNDWRELLRNLFADMLDAKKAHDWAQFERFGFSADDLSLRREFDRFPLGAVVGHRYQLRQYVGKGGLSTVYQAINSQSGEHVAVKVPHVIEGIDNTELLARVRAEAEILKQLSISGIPRFIELLETEHGPVLAIELIHGVPLHSLIPDGGLPTNEGLLVVAKVARVADALHQRGFVHGDIKPDNVFIQDDQQPILLDFNVSRASDPRQAQDGFPGGGLPYMSPESLVGVAADVDLRQDIFALGALLFHVLTGEELMTADSREEALVKSVLLGGAHEPHYPESMPEVVRRICRAAISRHPVSRFETAGDLADACELPVVSPDQDRQIPKIRPWLAAWRLGCALGLCIVRQRRVSTALQNTGEVPLEAGLPSDLLHELPNMAGVSTSIDELRVLANQLQLHLDEWPGANAYLSAFYTLRKLRGSDLEGLRAASLTGEAWCRQALEQLENQLTQQEAARASLFLAGVQSRFAPYSRAAAGGWLACASTLPLPAEITAEFVSACEQFDSALDWPRLVQGLDHHVIAYLRWHVGS